MVQRQRAEISVLAQSVFGLEARVERQLRIRGEVESIVVSCSALVWIMLGKRIDTYMLLDCAQCPGLDVARLFLALQQPFRGGAQRSRESRVGSATKL
jgi:hypothetical protein